MPGEETKILLASSFKTLVLKGRPFDKITIKQITSGAGIIRPSFYKHFQDKYDLLEWVFVHDVIEPSYALIREQMFEEAICLVFKCLRREGDFYRRVINIQGQNSFQAMVLGALTNWVLLLMEAQNTAFSQPYPWLTPQNIAWFYANSMTTVIVYWIGQNFPYSVDDIIDAYRYLGTHSIHDILKGNGK